LKDYSTIIEKNYQASVIELKKEIKPAVVSNGLFSKKDPIPTYKKSKKKKTLFSKK